MLAREPVGAVALALKKAGGAADAAQLAATTGLPRERVLRELHQLVAQGAVAERDGVWQLAQVA